MRLAPRRRNGTVRPGNGDGHPLPLPGKHPHAFVANARPEGERPNPWVLNLRAAGRARINIRGRTIQAEARELDELQAEFWWPALVEVWPAFEEHYSATGERAVFALHPIDGPA